MHIHILGICGTFMGGIAAIAREAGHRVTGCDANVYPPMSDQLQQLGVDLIEGFDIDQLALKPDLFVIGNVVARGNVLMEAILNQGLPYISGPQWLSEHILRGRHVVAVAGTHGKTTTSAMVAWVLQACGYNPGFLIGGVPLNFPVSACLGDQTAPFVIEADEYDTAFFDKRSKFVHYCPTTVILNNLEFDHADIFPDLAAIQTQFHHLVRTIPGRGRIVLNAQSDALQKVLDRGCWTPIVSFDDPEGWHVQPQVLVSKSLQSFSVHKGPQCLGQVDWGLLGDYNQSNALATIVAVEHVGVSVADACQALSQFQSVKRRMEVCGEVHGITVYDDFAHHATAIKLTIQALRQRVGSGRIFAVFEPRSNTMKRGIMKEALPAAFSDADAVFCYANGLSWDLAELMAPLRQPVCVLPELPALVDNIVKMAAPGDHILVMSNGGFGGIHGLLLQALAACRSLPQ